MQRVPAKISNFSRGELSPRLQGRSDTEVYYQGVATLENFIVLPQGGAERRPGTVYFGATQSASKKSRLVPFVEDEDTRYVLELYDGGIRVIKNTAGTSAFLTTVYTLTLDTAPASDWDQGATLTGGSSGTTCRVVKKTSGTEWIVTEPSGAWTDGEIISDGSTPADQGAGYPSSSASTVATPVYAEGSTTFYSEGELFAVKYVQIGSQMFFTHPDHQPKILTRMADTGWLLATMDAEVQTWIPSDETISVGSASDVANLKKFGGLQQVERSVRYEAGTLVKHSGNYYRAIKDVDGTDSGPSPSATYWEQVSSVDEDPFDTSGDYPRACAFFQDRVFVAGTNNRPNTVYGSGTSEYNFFIPGPNPADPVAFQLLSDRSDKIQWICSKDLLVVGTTGGEWVMAGGPDGLTPASVLAKRMTSFGSDTVQPRLVNDTVIFIQKGGRKIREYRYQNELQAHQAPDLTFFSDHISESGIVELEWQSDPDPILWAVRTDGTLVGLTYDSTNGTQGWHRHVTDGEFESIAVIPNDEEDQIWVTVKRTIDGSTVRYIEYFAPRYESAQRDLIHVDSALTLDNGATLSLTAATAANPVAVTSTAHGLSTNDHVRITGVTGMTELEGRVFQITVSDANTFTLNGEDGSGRSAATAGTVEQVAPSVSGLGHLEAATVDVQVDGGPHAAKTVASAAISLTSGSYGNTIHVGLPYESTIETMNVVAAIPGARKGMVPFARVRFIDTLAGKVGTNATDMKNVTGYTADAGEAPALFTGEKEVVVRSGFDDDIRVRVEQTEPAPMTVAVILPDLRVTQGGA